jgi:uncharacterized protein (TIGR00661 family)
VNVFYGICGEGLGHCGRSLALIERLIALGHRVTLFTFGDALTFLTKAGHAAHGIAGLGFREGSGGGVHVWGSLVNFARYLRSRQPSLDLIRQLALAERPDLFITDFEPLSAMAAASLQIPCFSVDSQHRFCQPLPRQFDARLRIYGRMAGAFVRWWIKKPQQCIVAVFHQCPKSPHYRRVDALLRDQIAKVQATDGGHVLLYGRGELGRRMARAASAVPQRFIAYGCEAIDAPNIVFKPTSYDGFIADLASCRAVVCAGGQQLIGEARYFGKPMLIVPIPRQHEQEINGLYAQQDGIGEFCPIEELSRERVERFLERRFAGTRPGNGVDQALEFMGISNGRCLA